MEVDEFMNSVEDWQEGEKGGNCYIVRSDRQGLCRASKLRYCECFGLGSAAQRQTGAAC